MPTKEKILESALELFSVHGYEDTSVAEIAAAVGIKAPSLYKHYRNKEEIFSAILQKIDEQYRNQAALLQLNGVQPEQDAARYQGITPDDLFSMVQQLFFFFLRDPYASRCRRMLVLEQYKNPRAAQLCKAQYFEGPLAYHRELFRQLIQAGSFRKEDPEVLALQFYAPIFLLLQLCDTAPQEIPAAERMLKSHVFTFHRVHKGEEES